MKKANNKAKKAQLRKQRKAMKAKQRPRNVLTNGNFKPTNHFRLPQTNDGIRVKLLIEKKDKRYDATEFQYGEVVIPNKCEIARSELISSLGHKWGHDGWALNTVGHYLSYSMTLNMVKSGFNAKTILSTDGHIHSVDLDKLGCYIKFEADNKGIYTDGPQFMTQDEVNDKAKQLHATLKSDPYMDVKEGSYA
jgi:hypothetical protein